MYLKLAFLVSIYLQWGMPSPYQARTVSEPATHPRMSGEDRRRQLIEIAIDLFSQRGLSGTTTRKIALAAGVTDAIIFRHFATKQDLYAAILDHTHPAIADEKWLAEVQARMDRDDDEG